MQLVESFDFLQHVMEHVHFGSLFFFTGNYSRLIAQIQFTRSCGYYVLQVYIPAMLMVMLSWIAFWLPRDAPGVRIGLAVLPLYVIMTIASSTRYQLPNISYFISIDCFLGTCLLLVLRVCCKVSLSATWVTLIASRKSKTEQTKDEEIDKPTGKRSLPAAIENIFAKCLLNKSEDKSNSLLSDVDGYSRLVFPRKFSRIEILKESCGLQK